MQTGYENYWMVQTGRQETSPNLPKNNTASQVLMTGNSNSYKPNQTQHAIRTVRYSNCVNNYIPLQNEANSNINRGAQSRGQPPQVYWTSSVVDGPNPHPVRHPFGNNFPQQVSAAQAKNFQYPIQTLQAWQKNFSSKQLGNSDLSLTHSYNNNNYNNNNTYYNDNVGSPNGEMVNGKAARIRVKDVFSINRVPGVQVPGNNFYGERVTEEYSCSLNFSPPECRKEDIVQEGYENVNLPSCRNLNHTQTEQYQFLTSGQQQFPQQGNPPIVSKSQFPGYDGTRVAEKNLTVAPFSSGGQTTVIAVASKSRTPNVLGENQRVKDERRKTVSEPIRSMNGNLYIPNPTSSPEKSGSQRFDLPVLLQSENDPPITCASTHYNNVPHTVIDLAIRNSSPKRNLSNNIGNTDVLTTKNLQSFVMNPGKVQQPGIVNRVQDKVVTPQSNTTTNKKRPSDLIVDNHTKKILKAEDDLKDDDCTEIKKEPQNCNLIRSEKPHKDGGNNSPKEISSKNIKNREKPSHSSPVDEPKTVYLSDCEIEESVFYHKKPGPKSKTMPEALEAAKNRMQYFDNHQEKANGDVKIRQEAKWDRNKLEMLKDYVISLTRIGKTAEGSKEVDSPQESESEGSCKRKNEEGLSRRRKLSKTSVIRNRNNEREMISLMSFKSAKVEITKCPGGSPLTKISDDGGLMVNSPVDKEPVNKGNETKCPDKDAKDHDGENSTEVTAKNKKGSKEEAAPQNKSAKERILFSPKKKDTFEETAIINTMRAFQNLEYHYCMSCDLVSSNSSFWINVVSAELRCLNCFKKMVFKAKEASFKCKHSHCREGSVSETKTEEEVNDKKEDLVAKDKAVDSGTTRVTASKSRRESSNEKCSNQKSEFSKIDSNAETVIKTEDGTQNRLEIDGQKKRESETISKTKSSYSHDDYNVSRVGLEEKVKVEGNPVSGSSESTRRKSTSKHEGSSHKTHVLDDRTKKEGKHSDGTKRNSSKDEVLGNKSESKNKMSTPEKTNRKRSFSGEDCSLGKDSSEKSKKRKEDPFTQRLISPKESNNEIKHSGSSDKERKHKEDKWKKLVSEKNWQSITKKHDEEDDDGEPVKQRRKSTTEIIFREKENTKTRSLSPAGELKKSKKEHKKKEEKVSHKMKKVTSEKQKALKVSFGRLITRDSPMKDKTKAFHRESGIVVERRHSEKISPDNNNTISKGKDHSGGEHSTKEKKIKGGDDFSCTPDHPPNIHPIKENNLKHGLKMEKHDEKRDVLFAQLLKKTKKLSKSLLEET